MSDGAQGGLTFAFLVGWKGSQCKAYGGAWYAGW